MKLSWLSNYEDLQKTLQIVPSTTQWHSVSASAPKWKIIVKLLTVLNTPSISCRINRPVSWSCSQNHSKSFWSPKSTNRFFYQCLFDCQILVNETVLVVKLWAFAKDLANRSSHKTVTPCLSFWPQILTSASDHRCSFLAKSINLLLL